MSSVIQYQQKQSPGDILQEIMLQEISENSQENTCTRVSFSIKLQSRGLQLYQKKTLAQVFSCEFSEISTNAFS